MVFRARLLHLACAVELLSAFSVFSHAALCCLSLPSPTPSVSRAPSLSHQALGRPGGSWSFAALGWGSGCEAGSWTARWPRLSRLGELGRPCSGRRGWGWGGSVLLHSGAHGPHQGINPFHLLSLQGVWGVRPPPSPGVRGRRAEGKDVGSLLQPHKSRRINHGPPGVT